MNKIRVLLADDNKDFCDVLGNYLGKAEDIEVVAMAHDGIEAYNKIRDYKPDVVILDGIMPRLDGWEFLKSCKTRISKNRQYVLCFLR